MTGTMVDPGAAAHERTTTRPQATRHVAAVVMPGRSTDELRTALVDGGFEVVDACGAALASVVLTTATRLFPPARSVVVFVDDTSDEDVVVDLYRRGADVVVGSSTGPHEVVARTRAVVRRIGDRPPDDGVVAGPLRLSGRGQVVDYHGVQVVLPQAEAEVLRLLVVRPGVVVSRATLARRLGTLDAGRSIDAVVRSLRASLEVVDATRRIVAVRGVGFRFDPS